jgi:hypothetical protein
MRERRSLKKDQSLQQWPVFVVFETRMTSEEEHEPMRSRALLSGIFISRMDGWMERTPAVVGQEAAPTLDPVWKCKWVFFAWPAPIERRLGR